MKKHFASTCVKLVMLTGRTSSLSGDLPKAKPIFFLSLRPNWSV